MKTGRTATDRRHFGWRHLDLLHGGRTFLRRRGIETPWFGVMIHRIDQADPGLDLHDHPWSFVTLILRGGYAEYWDWCREASANHLEGEWPTLPGWRRWERWSIHRMPLTVAHRIVSAEPGTMTLVIRGPKVRRWGFYLPSGWFDWANYDFETRRPVRSVDA